MTWRPKPRPPPEQRVTKAAKQRAGGAQRGRHASPAYLNAHHTASRRFGDPCFLRILRRVTPALEELHADLGELHDTPFSVHFREHDSACLELAEALPMLRREPPWGPLRPRSVHVRLRGDGLLAQADAARALAATLRLAGAVEELKVVLMRDAQSSRPVLDGDALSALCDAVIFCGTRRLCLVCGLRADAAPALCELLHKSSVDDLSFFYSSLFLDEATVAPVAEVLRDNTRIKALTLCDVNLWGDPAAGAAIFAALAGHPSIERLSLRSNPAPEELGQEVGEAFAALVAANSPALTHLDVSGSQLVPAELLPLLAALRSNTHLRDLNMTLHGLSELSDDVELAEQELFPAVEANASLRRLEFAWDDRYGIRTRVDALLAARRAADAEAQQAQERARA